MEDEDYCNAIECYKSGDLDKARNLFKKLLEANNDEIMPNVYRRLGILEFSETNYEKACEYFKHTLDKCGSTTPFAINIHNANKFKVINCAKDKNVDEDALAWTYHDYGYSLFALGDLGEARILLERAIETTPKKAWFLNDLGYYYYKQAEWKKANTSFKEAQALEEENGYAHILLGRTYYKENKITDAIRMYDVALKIFLEKIGVSDSDEIDSVFNQSTIIAKDKIGYIFQIIDIFNNKSRIELDRANYDEARDLIINAKKLIDKLETIVDTRKDIFPNEKRIYNESIATACNNLGFYFYEKGLYEAAKKEYERGLKKYESAELYYNLGILYRELGEEKHADKLIKISQRINPDIGKAKEFLSVHEDKPFSWWDWWFGNSKRVHHIPTSARFWTGIVLFIACAYFIGNMAYISWPSIDIISNETTQKLANNVTNVYKHTPATIENKIIILAILLFILILPQIKSFTVKDVKFELEPISKGSGGKQQ